MEYDVIIIGAGVSGAFVARELSRYQLSVCLVEKDADIAMGTSKANSAIVHAGYDAEPGSLKAILNVQGNEMMEQASKELDVHFKRIGSLVLAFKGDDLSKLYELKEKGLKNGVEGLSILGSEEVRQMEPNISQDVEAALYAPSGGIICPYELTIGAVENAVQNGVEVKLEQEVKAVKYENGLFTVGTDKDELKARFIVNAAGLYGDRIASLIGDKSIKIRPRKGQYMILDKSQGQTVSMVIFQLPSNMGKGILVTPTVDGNLLIGPSAEDIDDREDVSTTVQGLEQILLGARKSVPAFSLREVITSFSGLRAVPSTGDFVIGASSVNGKFINAVGIESPGLTAAPAIGRYVVDILAQQGLELMAKRDYNPVRKGIKRFTQFSESELNEIIKENPQYGRIICRCESVTEAEVVASIRRPVGARTVDAVKRRTRAGMGRCQGGFCSPRVVEILSRELGIPMEEVTKSGGRSKLLVGKTK